MKKAIIPIAAAIIAAAALVISIVAISIASSDHAFISELKYELGVEEPTAYRFSSGSEYSEKITEGYGGYNSYDSYNSYETPTAMTIPQSVLGE